MSVVDASVFTVLFADDPRRGAARALFSRENELHAPAIVVAETANALWKLMRSQPSLLYAVHRYVVTGVAEGLELWEDRDLIGDALEIATYLDHPVYDCLYVALAVRRDEPLYTFDERLIRKLDGTRLAGVARVPPA